MIKLKNEVTKGKHQRGIFFSLFYSKLRAQIPQKYVKDHTRESMFVEGWKEFSHRFPELVTGSLALLITRVHMGPGILFLDFWGLENTSERLQVLESLGNLFN